MRTLITIHGIIAATWMILAMVLCLKLALLGNEEKALAKQRGSDFQARQELTNQLSRQRSLLQYEASAPALEEAIRKLGLPLQPPQLAER